MKDLNVSLRNCHDPEARSFMSGVQGNILKFHSRLYARALFVTFTALPEEVRERLRTLAIDERLVTSALSQAEASRAWNEGVSRGAVAVSEPFGMLALSYHGYQHLRLTRFLPKKADNAPEYFSKGMRSVENSPYGTYWQPHADLWAEEYKDPSLPIDLFVLLADDDADRLQERVLRVKSNIGMLGKIVAEESLRRRIHRFVDPRQPIEHFGFRDGVSKPIFIQSDCPTPHEGFLDHSPVEPLSALFATEQELEVRQDSRLQGEDSQHGGSSLSKIPRRTHGSFLVVLKQEQNVRKFQQQTLDLAKELDVSHEEAQELYIGRRKDGGPLPNRVGKDAKSSRQVTTDNDFNYSGDPEGLRCPLHSHIRKVNPRHREKDLRPVLARRGMTYGPEREDLYPGVKQAAPSEGVGLMFMSFQSDLGTFINAAGAAQVPVKVTGIDPILSRLPSRLNSSKELRELYEQHWRKRDGKDTRFAAGDLVKPKGGEYFFAPSMYFLANLPRLVPDDKFEEVKPRRSEAATAS